MSDKTCFRNGLRQQLLRLVDPAQMRRFQDEHPFLDARHETLTQLRLDYPPEPLSYGPFITEFTPAELHALDTFLQEIQMVDDADDEEVVRLARNLLEAIPPEAPSRQDDGRSAE